MRFPPELGHRILNGHKTTHRIPIPTRTPATAGECPHRPGQHITLEFPETLLDSYDQPILDRDGQPRRTFAHDARLHVTTITVQALQDITEREARREGHTSIWAFFDWWAQHYHGTVSLDDDQLTQPVWVIGFDVVYADSTRYLARAAGYTSSRARAIDDLPVLTSVRDEREASRLAEVKRREQHRVNREDRERLSLETRIVQARAAAGVKGLRLRDEWQVLERLTARGDRRQVARALRVIERAVWPEAA